MAVTPHPPLRKDAERNRQRILEAAREVFAVRGLSATLDDIAHHAGVGVGTVYRRFPDKEQLIDALFEERIDEIAAAATESVAIEDPWDAVVHFLQRALELQAGDRGLKQLLLSTTHGQARVQHARLKIGPLVEAVLARGQAAGVVRKDITITDLVLLQHAVGEVASYAREADPDVWRRLLTIVLDGLRPDRRRPSPMPWPPLDDEGLDCAMGSSAPR